MKKIYLAVLLLGLVFTACENQDPGFPDFDYTTVYFAYQSPVRTLTMGEDLYDTTLDNAHKCQVMATMGGVYKNNKNITLKVSVDNSLCDNLLFNAGGDKVVAMPSSYYSLDGDQIVIPKGKFMGGIGVQFTDAFFADPLAVKNTYVIPLVINSVQNADSVLRGASSATSPNRLKDSDWSVKPKDYVLYAVKYINKWTGSYLRRGVDKVVGNNGNTALDNTIVYHEKYVEKDEICYLTTESLTKSVLTLNAADKNGVNRQFSAVIDFGSEGSNSCTVSAVEGAAYTITGNGTYAEKADEWAEKKRDAMYLKFNVDFGTGEATHQFTDTLVMRSRGVKQELFTPVLTK